MDIAARVLGVDRGGVDREIDARGGWVVRVDGHGAVIPASARDLQPLHKGEPLADDEFGARTLGRRSARWRRARRSAWCWAGVASWLLVRSWCSLSLRAFGYDERAPGAVSLNDTSFRCCS
jgi:hypothetical protein